MASGSPGNKGSKMSKLSLNTQRALSRQQWIRANTRSGARSSTSRNRGW